MLLYQACEMPRSLRTQIDKQINREWKAYRSGPVESSSRDPAYGHIRMRIDRKDLPALSAWLLEYAVGYTFSEDPAVVTDGSSQPRHADSGMEATNMDSTNLDGEPLVLVKVKVFGETALGDE